MTVPLTRGEQNQIKAMMGKLITDMEIADLINLIWMDAPVSKNTPRIWNDRRKAGKLDMPEPAYLIGSTDRPIWWARDIVEWRANKTGKPIPRWLRNAIVKSLEGDE